MLTNANSAGPDESDTAFLRNLGVRVRDARTRLAMSRKNLARSADVSERFLAQLESGTGNGSILLLRHVARALDVSLASLVDDAPSGGSAREATRHERIALIGLRGAGKSTLGAALAARMDVPFVELDREIERESGLALAAIFDMYGTAGFRRLERRCLEATLAKHPRFILATSGSIVAESANFDRLRATCYTVWLRAQPEEHMARVVAQGDLRPMGDNAEAMDDLRAILASREPAYARADTQLDTSGSDAARVLDRLEALVTA